MKVNDLPSLPAGYRWVLDMQHRHTDSLGPSLTVEDDKGRRWMYTAITGPDHKVLKDAADTLKLRTDAYNRYVPLRILCHGLWDRGWRPG